MSRNDWDADKAADLACTIAGWMNLDELRCLYRLASLYVPAGGTWVEVGCWKGRSLVATALGLPDDTIIYGVDNFRGNPGSEVHWEAGELLQAADWLKNNFLANATAAALLHGTLRFMLITENSVEAASEFPDGTVDGIFIDANHEEAAVAADILAWSPKVKKGGLLCGHDMNVAKFPGVRAAVSQLVPRWLPGPGSLWFYVVQ